MPAFFWLLGFLFLLFIVFFMITFRSLFGLGLFIARRLMFWISLPLAVFTAAANICWIGKNRIHATWIGPHYVRYFWFRTAAWITTWLKWKKHYDSFSEIKWCIPHCRNQNFLLVARLHFDTANKLACTAKSWSVNNYLKR